MAYHELEEVLGLTEMGVNILTDTQLLVQSTSIPVAEDGVTVVFGVKRVEHRLGGFDTDSVCPVSITNLHCPRSITYTFF